MTRYAMAVDLNRCQGCRGCMTACKVENNTVEGNHWMYVFRFEEGSYPDTRMSFLPRPCQHCDNAPCVKVCPVGARYKRDDGLVLTDPDRCIGCRYCELACPYGVNYFNWQKPEKAQYPVVDWGDEALAGVTGGAIPPYKNPDLAKKWGPEQRRSAGGGQQEGVMEKCTFCVQRVEQGRQPACVETCPTDALIFGDLDDPETPVSRYINDNRTWTLLEEAGTKPRVYYIGGKPPTREASEIERPKATV